MGDADDKPKPNAFVVPETALMRADRQIAEALEFNEARLTLPEMVYHLDLEAALIEGSERARLVAGLTAEPNLDQIARIARCMSIMKFIQRLHDRPDDAATHFQAIARKRNSSE